MNTKFITSIMLAMLMTSFIAPMVLAEEAVTISEDTDVIATTEEVELEDAGTLPDSPMYGLDKAMDRLRLAFTFNKEKKAELALKISEERLAEVKAMIEAKDFENAEKAQERHELMIARAQTISEEMEADGDEAKAELALLKSQNIQTRLEAHTEKVNAVHSRILERQRERMTEEQITKLEEVFGKIQTRLQEAMEKTEQRQETIRTRYKALSGLSDEEIDSTLEQRREAIKAKIQTKLATGDEDESEVESENVETQVQAGQENAGENSA